MPNPRNFAMPNTEKSGFLTTSSNDNNDNTFWWWLAVGIGILFFILIVWALVYWFRGNRYSQPTVYVDECGKFIGTNYDACRKVCPTNNPCPPVHHTVATYPTVQPMPGHTVAHYQAIPPQMMSQITSPVGTTMYPPGQVKF